MKKHFLITAVTLILLSVALSGCTSTENWEEIDVTTDPFLWIIEGDNPSYLYGSMHSADERVLTVPEVVMDALNDADIVYGEIILDQEAQLQFLQLYMLPEEQTLDDVLPQEVNERFNAYLISKGFIPTAFARFKIWMAAAELSFLDEIENMQENEYLDEYIENLAVSKNKEVGGLETIEEQATVLDSLTLEEQIHFLTKTLDELEEYEVQGESLHDIGLNTYIDGNLEALQDLMYSNFDEEDPVDIKVESLLFVNRNHRMSERISELIDTNPDKQFFFVIGAGHFIGDDGIIQLLENNGFSVTRLECNECDECNLPKVKMGHRCYYPYSKSTIIANELLDRDFIPGDTIVLKDILKDVKKINTSYGEYTILLMDADIDNIGIFGDNNLEYVAGVEISQTLHIKDYQFNGIKLLSAIEMYGLYIQVLSAIEIAFDATSQYAGIGLTLKSIDGNGNTQYIANTNGSLLNLDELNLKLLKMNYDVQGKSFDDNINSSIELFAIEYSSLYYEDYSEMEEVDSMESLENNESQNGFIHFVDNNSNGYLDDNDILNVYISSTDDEYSLETYLLLIGNGIVSSWDDVSGIKYIINWYNGVYSQEDTIYS